MVVSHKEYMVDYMHDKTGITVPIELRDKIKTLKKRKGEKLSCVIERLFSLYKKVEEIKKRKQNLNKKMRDNNAKTKIKQRTIRASTD